MPGLVMQLVEEGLVRPAFPMVDHIERRAAIHPPGI